MYGHSQRDFRASLAVAPLRQLCGGGPWERHAARLEVARARRVHCCAARPVPLRCSFAVRWPHTAAVRPVLALQPQAASTGCARGHCLSSPPPSREPQRYAPSSPPARKRSSVRCGRRIILVPSFASPGEVHPKVRCQRSSRRTGQRGLRPGCPRLVLGCQQLCPPRGAQGVQQAAPAARILSMFPARQRGV